MKVSRRVFFTIFLVISVLFSLISCTSKADVLRDKLNGKFQAEICIKQGDTATRATVSLTPYVSGKERDIHITLTSPESASGMMLEMTDGKTFMGIDGFDVPSEYAVPLLTELIKIFTVESGTSSVFKEGNGLRAVADGDTRVHFLKDGTPFLAVRGDTSVEILSFKTAK